MSSIKAKACKDLRFLKVRLGIENMLLSRFSQPDAQLERKIIQSNSFRHTVLSRWATWCVDNNRVFDDPKLFMKHISVRAPSPCGKIPFLSPDIDWFLNRIETGGIPLERSPRSAFPSTLARTGPQYPFTPQEFEHLRNKAGALRGTEMTRVIEVNRRKETRPEKLKEKIPSFFTSPIEDNEDRMIENPLNPKSTRFWSQKF